ncbi:MAG: hypothetical protein AAFW84_06905 [Cyanobacteria bacterium J06635_15]
MVFPSQFDFPSEEAFIAQLVSPLLNRLGFSTVIDYHGSSEFGKDLVVAEFDRMSHVRYHGIQVKYVSSISLSAVDDLIRDCQQAFTNPFHHPQTGEENHISTFYAVNGGSISDQAKSHFFNSLKNYYGDNVKLLDGKSLIALDRSATVISVESVRSALIGILLELSYNRSLIEDIYLNAALMVNENGSYPLARLYCDAASSYLQHPYFCLISYAGHLRGYVNHVRMFNKVADMLGEPCLQTIKESRLESLAEVKRLTLDCDAQITPAVEAKLMELGPLIAP